MFVRNTGDVAAWADEIAEIRHWGIRRVTRDNQGENPRQSG
jgi:hypothetical protein